MRRLGAFLVLAAMTSGCVGAAPPTPVIVYVTPVPSEDPTRTPTERATPVRTLAPTPTLVPTPTPTPTPTPAQLVTEDELLAACEGTPIPHAAKYAGTVHPLVVVDTWGEIDPDWYAINAKWADDRWPSPIQLVLCVDDAKTVKVGSCGTYTRRSDGAEGQIIRYRYTQKVRVVVARTGKQTGYTTLAGSIPTCKSSLSIPASGPPPWDYYGDDVSNDAINKYATSVSKQRR